MQRQGQLVNKATQWFGVGVALVPAAFVGATLAEEGDDDAVSSDVEEVIVTAERPETGFVLPFEYMQQTYDARGKGACFYQRGKYEEAFPYLIAAAKRGFKFAQARVGYLYERGLGVSRDPYAAVGWYAVAAEGRTHPEIKSYFRDVWRRIPEEHLPRFEAVAEEYRTTYGARANRVTCDMDRAMGSYLPKLTCRFMDEAIHNDWAGFARFWMEAGPGEQVVPGFFEPLRANRGSC